MKVCFFDIDGTLVLTGEAGKYAFAETFAEEFGVEELSKDCLLYTSDAADE